MRLDPPLRLKGPLSFILLRLHRLHRLFAVGTCIGAVGRVSPTAVKLLFVHRTLYVLASAYVYREVKLYRGSRTSFPTAVVYDFVFITAKVFRFDRFGGVVSMEFSLLFAVLFPWWVYLKGC